MYKPKPEWLRVRIQGDGVNQEVQAILKKHALNTVCREAKCPNSMECFKRRTATFMILGSVCTRNCTFCNVTKGTPQSINPEEPLHIAQAVKELGLKHAVITSVTRDDLPDGGASHFAEVVEEIRKMAPEVTIEVLIPDFRGSREALYKVAASAPDIINHNIETVPALYSQVRPMASYDRSLILLQDVKVMNKKILTKSGIMLGLGETEPDVLKVMADLCNAGCDILTIGQYLAPSPEHYPVIEYVHPDIFEKYRSIGIRMGFNYVASAPLVRSSYHAEEALSF